MNGGVSATRGLVWEEGGIFKSGSSSGSAADQPVCSDQRVDGAAGASTWRLNVTGGGESERGHDEVATTAALLGTVCSLLLGAHYRHQEHCLWLFNCCCAVGAAAHAEHGCIAQERKVSKATEGQEEEWTTSNSVLHTGN